MTAPNTMMSACTRGHGVEEAGVDELHARHEQLGADHERHRPADEEHHELNTRYIVPMSLWFVVVKPALDALGGRVVVVLGGVPWAWPCVCVVLICLFTPRWRPGGSPLINRGGEGCASALPGVAAACRAACLGPEPGLELGCVFTSTTTGMKPWSRPHSSAHWPR